jgi:ABC-2 type transport system ATP-binding protein
LFDEILPSDDLVVLHQGRVLAQSRVARVLEDAGVDNVNTAFMRLTGTAERPGSPAP